MQVERKPPLWPYLATLMLLLGMCLAAPQYWTTELDRPTTEPVAAQGASIPASRQRVELAATSPASGVQFDLPAQRSGSPLTLPRAQRRLIVGRAPGVLVYLPPVAEPASLETLLPGVDLAAVLRRIGRAAAVQPKDLAAPLISLVAERIQRSAPARVVASPPRLVPPTVVRSSRDRLAMIPERRSPRPRAAARSLDVPPLGVAKQPWERGRAGTTVAAMESPLALIEQLERLQRNPTTMAWATRALAGVDALTAEQRLTSQAASTGLDQLAHLADDARKLAESLGDERLRTELLRAHYGLERRLGCWSLVHQIRTTEHDAKMAAHPDSVQLEQALEQLSRWTEGFEQGAAWRDYLLADRLSSTTTDGHRLQPAERRRLAQQVLGRVASARMTMAQRQFVAREPIVALAGELRHWAVERVDLAKLNSLLETYERTRSPRIARKISASRQQLAWSPHATHRDLARQIDQHYRNANLRLAVTAELLNDLLPQPKAAGYQPVRDRIVGTPVRGRQRTDTALRTQLIPDDKLLRFRLQAVGNVESQTVSLGDGARLWTRGTTDFEASKAVTVTYDGMQVDSAVASAQSNSRLVKLHTDYESWPLICQVARNEAKSQYRQKRGRASLVVEQKVSRRAEEQLDDEAGSYLARLREKISGRLERLEKSGVHVEPIALSTTPERLVARLRIAADDQLASHTPRNRAPADSLASLQVHETVVSNLARGLGLEGERLTAVQLRDRLDRFVAEPGDGASDEDVPDDMVFHFAYEDALQFRFEAGQLELIVALVELIHDRQAVRHFKVHAFYEPRIEGVRLSLVRSGALGIEGRIRTGERARLHAIFNKIFDDGTEIPLVDPEQMNLPLLEGVMTTQAVLEDGWLGIALGPEIQGRTAQRIRSFR